MSNFIKTMDWIYNIPYYVTTDLTRGEPIPFDPSHSEWAELRAHRQQQRKAIRHLRRAEFAANLPKDLFAKGGPKKDKKMTVYHTPASGWITTGARTPIPLKEARERGEKFLEQYGGGKARIDAVTDVLKDIVAGYKSHLPRVLFSMGLRNRAPTPKPPSPPKRTTYKLPGVKKLLDPNYRREDKRRRKREIEAMALKLDELDRQRLLRGPPLLSAKDAAALGFTPRVIRRKSQWLQGFYKKK